MGIFICHECGHMGDSDDGCDATEDGMNLICIRCVTEHHSEDAPLNTNGRVDSLENIWNALHSYRETCIPEGDPLYDREWDEICTDMAWIAEELGIDHNA